MSLIVSSGVGSNTTCNRIFLILLNRPTRHRKSCLDSSNITDDVPIGLQLQLFYLSLNYFLKLQKYLVLTVLMI